MWILQVLGPVSLCRSESRETLALGRRSQAALAWLATRDVPASRSALVDLLWRDSPQSDGRNSLRQLLFQLRRVAGGHPVVRSQGESLQMDATMCDVDLGRFLALARSPLQVERLAACPMYRGEFAEGLDCSPSFDAWCAAERESVKRIAANLLQRLAEEWDGSRHVEIAASLARRLLASDPDQEATWRALIVLYEKAGLVTTAQSVREECHRTLGRESERQPFLARRLLDGSLHSPSEIGTIQLALGRARAPHLHPDDAEAAASDHLLRGFHHYYAGSADSNVIARNAFEAASALNPTRADAAVLAAWTHFTDFNFAWNGPPVANYLRAAAAARNLSRRFTGDPFVFALEAKLRLWRGDFAGAVDGFMRAVRGLPEYAATWSNAADALLRSGRSLEALGYVQQAMALEPENRGVFHCVAGQIYFALGELEQAQAAFETALRRNDRHCVATIGVAAVQAELGRLVDARETAHRVRGLRGGMPYALHLLGPLSSNELRTRWIRAFSQLGCEARPERT